MSQATALKCLSGAEETDLKVEIFRQEQRLWPSACSFIQHTPYFLVNVFILPLKLVDKSYKQRFSHKNSDFLDLPEVHSHPFCFSTRLPSPGYRPANSSGWGCFHRPQSCPLPNIRNPESACWLPQVTPLMALLVLPSHTASLVFSKTLVPASLDLRSLVQRETHLDRGSRGRCGCAQEAPARIAYSRRGFLTGGRAGDGCRLQAVLPPLAKQRRAAAHPCPRPPKSTSHRDGREQEGSAIQRLLSPPPAPMWGCPQGGGRVGPAPSPWLAQVGRCNLNVGRGTEGTWGRGSLQICSERAGVWDGGEVD